MKNFLKDFVDVQKYKIKYNTIQNKCDEIERKYIDLLEQKSEQIDFIDSSFKRILVSLKDLKTRVSDLETKKKR